MQYSFGASLVPAWCFKTCTLVVNGCNLGQRSPMTLHAYIRRPDCSCHQLLGC
jgi:hypothetical protein